MKLTEQEARDIVNEDHEFWRAETSEQIIDHHRWSVSIQRVFKHTPSGKFYEFLWMRGATEQQWEEPFEGEKEVEVVEVKSVEKVVIDWVPV